MRLFVAVFPPEEVRRNLIEAARMLEVGGDVRWVRPEGVHLTLKFLGEVPEERVDEVRRAIEKIGGRHESFGVEISGFGAFPSRRRARVVWAGVGEGAKELAELAGDVEHAMQGLGFARERRPYRPHLTLGRARKRPVSLGPEERDPPGERRFTARRVELVRSILGPEGATYLTLAAARLSEDGE